MENKQKVIIKTEDKIKKEWEAKELSNFCTRSCFNPRQRALDIKFRDEEEVTVLKLVKDFACNCCNSCCLPEMRMIDLENDTDLGWIRMNCSMCPRVDVTVFDEQNDLRFYIQSESCTGALFWKGSCFEECFREIAIPINDRNGNKVASIIKSLTGVDHQSDPDQNSFVCRFHMELTIREKALLMGACFMVDIGQFEYVHNKNQQEMIKIQNEAKTKK